MGENIATDLVDLKKKCCVQNQLSECDQGSNKPTKEQDIYLIAVSKDEHEDFGLNIGFMILFYCDGFVVVIF